MPGRGPATTPAAYTLLAAEPVPERLEHLLLRDGLGNAHDDGGHDEEVKDALGHPPTGCARAGSAAGARRSAGGYTSPRRGPRRCYHPRVKLAALFLASGVLSGALAADRPAAAPARLSIAAAANLKPAFEEIVRAFEARRPGVEVTVDLRRVRRDLRADPERRAVRPLPLRRRELPARSSSPRGSPDGPRVVYACGRLVAVGAARLAARRRAGAASPRSRDPSVRRIAIANPASRRTGAPRRRRCGAPGCSRRCSAKLVLGAERRAGGAVRAERRGRRRVPPALARARRRRSAARRRHWPSIPRHATRHRAGRRRPEGRARAARSRASSSSSYAAPRRRAILASARVRVLER